MKCIEVSSTFHPKRTHDTENSFPAALKQVRKSRGLSQESFSDVSSRTYLSSLERGLKSPTLNKVAELCEVLEVHPLTLMTLAYIGDSKGADKLFERVQRELAGIQVKQNK